MQRREKPRNKGRRELCQQMGLFKTKKTVTMSRLNGEMLKPRPLANIL